MAAPVALVISGSMGSGKTTVMGEASDLLLLAGIRHAAIDLDAIAAHLLPEPDARRLHYQNVASWWENCTAAGIDRFLIAVAIESESDLDHLRIVLTGAAITVCRLTAAGETMAARVRQREPGMRQEEFVARSRALEEILSRAALEDFMVSNDCRPITDVAHELLVRAGWL